MNPIDQLFQKLRSQKRRAFIPFITAGDPDLDTTRRLLAEVVRRGADLVEVGFPYSDPIADGSVIQASYTRALGRGLHMDDVFSLTASPGRECTAPLAAMVSFSLVHHRGPEKFVAQARKAGFSGAIVPDLPVEEAEELGKFARQADFKLIQLVTPTTPPERAKKIARAATGFLYVVSVTGITGERSTLPPQLLEQLHWLRGQTDLPLCVGFGISRPEHVLMLRDHVDGVIVGSALVRKLEMSRPVENVVRDIGDLVQSLAGALNP